MVETKIKAHCPKCRGIRNTTILGHHRLREDEEEDAFWSVEEHFILRCDGCETLVHRKDYTFSEDYDEDGPIKRTTYWPPEAKRNRPPWLEWQFNFGKNSTLYELAGDIYIALDNNLSVLAAIGARTTFDHASELLGVDPAIGFAEKLSALIAKGHIGTAEKVNLEVLTEAGNAAAHRGWKPSTEQLNTIMSILEHFIYRNFVIAGDAERLKDTLPSRPPRQKDETEGG
jgi:hypothetical protein